MDWAFNLEEWYGQFWQCCWRRNIKRLDYNGKKSHVKELWEENPKTYFQWKNWCIELNRLPDFFGTRDNPIPIDESKL